MSKPSKIYSIICLICFFSFTLFIFANPAQAEEDTKKVDKLKWNAAECTTKCGLIKAEMILKIGGENADPIIQKKINDWDCVKGQSGADVYCYAPPMATTLQVPIGDTKVVFGLVDYIVKFFEWGTKAIAVIAVVMIMFAGIQWLAAAGNSGAIDKAKTQIKNSIIGLVLVLTSVFLLNMINPALTNLKGLEIKMVPTIAQGTFWCKDLDLNLKEGDLIKNLETIDVSKQANDVNYSNKYESGQVGACGVEYQIGENKCFGNMCRLISGEKTFCLRKILDFSCERCTIYGGIEQNREVNNIKLWGFKFQGKNEFHQQASLKEIEISKGVGNYCLYVSPDGLGKEDYLDISEPDKVYYFLEVLCNQGWGRDDWYAIKNNGEPFLGEDGKPLTAVKLLTYGENKEELEKSRTEGKLWTFEELSQWGKKLDINMSERKFPPR